MSRRVAHFLVLGAGLGSFAALAVSSAASHSATFDETAYLPSGFAALVEGDYRTIPVHPPLGRMLTAVPLLALDVRLDRDDPAWREGHPWKFGHRFLYEWNDADTLLLWSRMAMVGLAAALAAAVFMVARRRWGIEGGTLALLLCVLSPDVLAHGSLATSDLPVACFFFLTVAAFERALAGGRWGGAVLTGLAFGGAVLSKHSAVLLIPVLAGLASVFVLRPGTEPVRRRGGWALGLLALAAAVAVVTLWAGYRFRYSATADPAGTEPLRWREAATEEGPLATVLRFTGEHHLLPEAYVNGWLDFLTRSQERRAFLLGDRSSRGWWYYFLVTFLLKTPLPLLVLLAVAIVRLRREPRPPGTWLALGLPVAIYAGAALTSHVNIGHRYLLPIYPFLFVAAGAAAPRLLRGGWRGSSALALLVAWYTFGTLANHPHHLAYFNELGGGPSEGHRHLVDSNVDWGQDLKRLRQYLEANGIRSIKLSYFGTADPAYYRIPGDLLPSSMRPIPGRFVVHVMPGDTVVVSATNLQGVYLPREVRPLMERLRGTTPVARVGRSLLVYRPDFRWLLRPDAAESLGWLPQAVASYREVLRLDPEDDRAREYLASAVERLERSPAPRQGDPDSPSPP